MIALLVRSAWRAYRLDVRDYREVQRGLTAMTIILGVGLLAFHIWVPLAFYLTHTWPMFLYFKNREWNRRRKG